MSAWKPLNLRFETKFRVTPGCWIWTAGTRNGYGAVWGNGKMERAHRVSYETYVGPIPDGLLVRHKCDNKLCVNPDHLLTGTHKENVQDMFDRSRQPDLRGKNAGEKCARSKLKNHQVIAIRADSRLTEKIATDYGVSPQHISRIKRMEAWKHLPDDRIAAQQGAVK